MIPEEILSSFLPEIAGIQNHSGRPPKVRSISGGSINEAYLVSYPQTQIFVKINSSSIYPRMFEIEEQGLSLLGSTKTFDIPEVFGFGSHEEVSFLAMEYMKPGSPGSEFAEDFGTKLARLHRTQGRYFGLDQDNYIGSLPQRNDQRSGWIDFFVDCRLEPQLKMASSLLSASDRSAFDKLFHRLDQLVPIEVPALLHGDLWSGNFLVNESGLPVLIDPAVYYGHREVDLSMMKLFGGFPNELFQYYHKEYPLEHAWEERVDLHNLYPLLVHLNLFGGSYLRQVQSNLRKYL